MEEQLAISRADGMVLLRAMTAPLSGRTVDVMRGTLASP